MTHWLTLDEMKFLDRIGQHTVGPREGVRISDRIRHLRSYVHSMDKRVIWGPIDKTQVRRHAERLIESYEGLLIERKD
jgi:hypothetical protein